MLCIIFHTLKFVLQTYILPNDGCLIQLTKAVKWIFFRVFFSVIEVVY